MSKLTPEQERRISELVQQDDAIGETIQRSIELAAQTIGVELDENTIVDADLQLTFREEEH